MTPADPILSVLQVRPMASSELYRELWCSYRMPRTAAAKRLERLTKRGRVCRYLRLRRGAYLYYLPGHHSDELLKATARKVVSQCGGPLARVLTIVARSRVLSTFELGRIANARFFTDGEEPSQPVLDLKAKAQKLGIRLVDDDFLVCLPSEIPPKKLIAEYEAAVDAEANLLAYTRRLFLTNRRAQKMTIYREPSIKSLALNKFDAVGYGGETGQIRVILECNLRREVVAADLESFSLRVAGTIGAAKARRRTSFPTARYYLAGKFSADAMTFARDKNKGIRLLDLATVQKGALDEIGPYGVTPKRQLLDYGRFLETKGIAFEAEVEQAYRRNGFDTMRRRRFYLSGGSVTTRRTGRLLTDIDLFAERTEIQPQVLLVECKSGREMLARTELFDKTRRYVRVARHLASGDPELQVMILVIAKVDARDRDELKMVAKWPLDFRTPEEFYRENQKALKGTPRWLFGAEGSPTLKDSKPQHE